MPFTKETAALAGSKSSRKGTPNKEIKALRERIELLLEENWDKLMEDYTSLSSKDRINATMKMLEFVVPKLSRTEVNDRLAESLSEQIHIYIPDNGRDKIPKEHDYYPK